MLTISFQSCGLSLTLQAEISHELSGSEVRDVVHYAAGKLGLLPNDIYLTQNGKLLSENSVNTNSLVNVHLRANGGKGGFGSMLRAIGAQIEKTTNREACRDLSGRRLRDINEEKLLKKWIGEQAEREKEEAAKKKKKLEKLCSEPKHEFNDSTYDKERAEMPDKIHDAVEQGMRASTSSVSSSTLSESSMKRKLETSKPRGSLWIDVDDDELSDSSDEETQASEAKKIKSV